MSRFPLCVLSIAALAFSSGCAILKKEELADLRAKHVSEALVRKLQKREPLLSSEVVELSQHHMPDVRLGHYIRRTGMATTVRESEIQHMKNSRVSPEIIRLVELESEKLEADNAAVGSPNSTLPAQPVQPPPPIAPGVTHPNPF
jgi:hypothetical protein